MNVSKAPIPVLDPPRVGFPMTLANKHPVVAIKTHINIPGRGNLVGTSPLGLDQVGSDNTSLCHTKLPVTHLYLIIPHHDYV